MGNCASSTKGQPVPLKVLERGQGSCQAQPIKHHLIAGKSPWEVLEGLCLTLTHIILRELPRGYAVEGLDALSNGRERCRNIAAQQEAKEKKGSDH